MDQDTEICKLPKPDEEVCIEEGAQYSPPRRQSTPSTVFEFSIPQQAPGASAAIGHTIENSIPLSIFPIATDKFCFIFSGLPARGKTYISRRIARYLDFFHAIPVQVFDVANYRRKLYSGVRDAAWFDAKNEEGSKARGECNDAAHADIIAFLAAHSNGVAILDSTSSTHERRAKVVEKLCRTGAKIIFIEVICEDENCLLQMYKNISESSPDYAGVESEEAIRDYRKRIDNYKIISESLSETHPVEQNWSFFKCDHSRNHFIVHKVRGYLPLKVIHFIMNLNTTPRQFFLSRHGQSEYNQVGRIGGDSGLSKEGVAYAHALADFVDRYITKDSSGNTIPARLWTSSLQRTKQTAQFIRQDKLLVHDSDTETMIEWYQMKPRVWSHLDELFAGSCDGLTYEQIEEMFPDEFALRQSDKLAYRYPRGESYLDVIARLEPIIIEMERHREPLLIIGHQGILRIIYAFYMGLSRSEAPYVSIHLNTVYEMVPTAYHCAVNIHTLYVPPEVLASDGQDEPTSDSHRPYRPKSFAQIDPPSH